MTVETANISTAIPPKKRDYSEYPASCSPTMSEEDTLRVTPRTPSPSPSPRHPANPLSPAELHAMASKTGPLRSSGFMITDILSGANAGLSPLSLLPPASLQSQFQRIPSPHDSDSSDTGSNNNHDISDDGEDGESQYSLLKDNLPVYNASIEWWLAVVMTQTKLSIFLSRKASFINDFG